MKHFLTLAFFLSLSLALSGCGLLPRGDQGNLGSDFQPPSAPASNPDPQQAGPQDRVIKIATSTDGLTYTSTGEIISYQAYEPELIEGANGEILLYYTGWILGDRLNRSAVAISDEGKIWVYKY